MIILHILHTTNLQRENLKAHADSLEAQLKGAESRLQESRGFNKDFHLTISHEFRNPLNNIMGNLEIVQKELASDDPNQEHLKTAKLGGEILLNSLNNALDFFKLEVEEIDVHFVSVNIRKCLEKSWAVFSEMLRLRGLQGELYLHANVPPFVMMDPGRLHQILMNLVHNSSKFTSEGFVKIIISWHPCVVAKSEVSLSTNSEFSSQNQISQSSFMNNSHSSKRTSTPDTSRIKHTISDEQFNEDEFSEYPSGSQKITFSPSMNYNKLDLKIKKFPRMHKRRIPSLSNEAIGFLKVQIIDSGIGIHNSNLAKMFQKFSKFSYDSKHRVEGSGLGLFITKEICNKMEGSIRVYSDFKKGSTFLVFLKCEISPQSLGTPTPSPCLSDRRDRSNLQTMSMMPILNQKANGEVNVHKRRESKNDEPVKLKAMVVDDIPYNQELNKKFLQLCGVDVKAVAENGLEAYKLFTSGNEKDLVDVVFMDLDMPVMDGKTSSMKIREWEKKHHWKPAVIVILTANCSETELRYCLDKNGTVKADYFYRKPLSLSDCQNLIQQITREKTKKKVLGFSLPKLADHVLLYEKDLFQQVLLENYLRVGQIKYTIANRDNILEKFIKLSDNVCVVLYNCEDVEENIERLRKFVKDLCEYLRRKGRSETPILGIMKETEKHYIPTLRELGFRDFLLKPFDYENIIKLLRSHTMNSLPI